MAASSNMKRNYHVFLSFRGTDVRHGFLSHLYAALDQQGIYTFVDSEELRKGEEISPALMRVIEQSRVAIIVFSGNYASSPWCLEEVAKIMECKVQNDLIVFPVFYKVEPREVRKGRESYGRAMAEHESKFGNDLEKVKRWKKALLDAGSLSGWHFNDRRRFFVIFLPQTMAQGTDAVKAIVLDLSPPEAIIISPDAFTNMKKLRMLIFLGVDISSQAQVRLPNELRWLEWPNAPNLEFGSGPNKLVRLDVSKSHIRQLGGNSQKFRVLKFINFRKCKSLVSIHDLSSAPNMEKMILNGCESLVEVHPSIGNLGKLKVLSLESCSNLSNFPNTLRTKSLEALILSGCSKFEKFPDIDGKMEHLHSLYLNGTAIKELPSSIENLVSVEGIELAFCKNLIRLPWHIYKLKNLELLNLSDYLNLITFPKNMEDSTDPNVGFRKLRVLKLCRCNPSEVDFLESFFSFPMLERLYLSDNKFTHLPACINKYHSLCELFVNRCELLQEIPQLPPSLVLSARCCKSLQKFPDLGGRPDLALSVDLTSCCELSRRGITMADVADLSLLEDLPKVDRLNIKLPGREMPKWILPCEGDSISFMIPQELYDKFKGVALCVVLGPEEGKVVNASFTVGTYVNGESAGQQGRIFYSIESDHVWFNYYPHLFVDL